MKDSEKSSSGHPGRFIFRSDGAVFRKQAKKKQKNNESRLTIEDLVNMVNVNIQDICLVMNVTVGRLKEANSYINTREVLY